MKKIATLLIALIAIASVSFAGTTGPSTDFSKGNWSTYGTQAIQQEVVVSDAGGGVPGLWSTYSVANELIDYSSFDKNTNLEGFLAQLDQATYSAEAVADAGSSAEVPYI
jgi:hypothetical protein